MSRKITEKVIGRLRAVPRVVSLSGDIGFSTPLEEDYDPVRITKPVPEKRNPSPKVIFSANCRPETASELPVTVFTSVSESDETSMIPRIKVPRNDSGLRVGPIEIKRINSDGKITHSTRDDAPEMSKIEEVYFAEVPKHGTIRAGHKHEKTEEIFVILKGSGKFIFVDDRKDSPNYGEINSFILSGKNKSALLTPIGVYHAWVSIEDNTECLAISSKAYHKEDTDTYQTDLEIFGNELKLI